jgi:hypothetical protein
MDIYTIQSIVVIHNPFMPSSFISMSSFPTRRVGQAIVLARTCVFLDRVHGYRSVARGSSAFVLRIKAIVEMQALFVLAIAMPSLRIADSATGTSYP